MKFHRDSPMRSSSLLNFKREDRSPFILANNGIGHPSAFIQPTVQTKLSIGEPNDKYEREADSVADKVVNSKPDIQASAETEKDESVQPKLQMKAESATGVETGIEDQINSAKGKGRAMDAETNSFMSSRFDADFSNVRIHTDDTSVQMSKQLGAKAFAHGSDIHFNKGQYNPNSKEGKHLLAHELTHTIQQKGNTSIQRSGGPWRYNPPATVTRSIVEIQGIVGSTPDGVYGPQTRDAVKAYQRVLTAHGLYANTVDGKWGDNTELAHITFALKAPKRRGYNCAGFAFKQFVWVDYAPTKAILAGMRKLPGHASKPPAKHHKFWFWDIVVSTKNTRTGATTPAGVDFHIVGGQTDKNGAGPNQVMSKNGQRPVEGPKPPLDWEIKTGQALNQDNVPIPDVNWVIHRSDLSVHSNVDLP